MSSQERKDSAEKALAEVKALPFRMIQVSWKPKGLDSRKEKWIRLSDVLKILSEASPKESAI